MQAMFGHDPPISFRSITAVRRPALAMAQARFLPASPLPMISKSNCCLSGIVSPKIELFKSWFVDDRQPELNRLQSVDTVRDLFPNCYKRYRFVLDSYNSLAQFSPHVLRMHLYTALSL